MILIGGGYRPDDLPPHVESGHKETYSTALPHDRCTFDCGRFGEAEKRLEFLNGKTSAIAIRGVDG